MPETFTKACLFILLYVAVLPFEEVLARSYCRPVETMVGVAGEVQLAPGASVRPVCVQLRRCTGCCTDGKFYSKNILKSQLVPFKIVSLQSHTCPSSSSTLRCTPGRLLLESSRAPLSRPF
uniref:Platelet-derived growth factor (PDGF) family profile domain-containing protein n=1 Tax=Eptatretus burgeri TaxID=7764 RepID=A0A8C4R569_EPTBU